MFAHNLKSWSVDERVILLHAVVCFTNTIELQWLEHFWDHENLFETGVVRVIEGLLWNQDRRHKEGYLFDFLQYEGTLCVLIRIASARRF